MNIASLTQTLPVSNDLSEVVRVNAQLCDLWAERQLPLEMEAPVTLALEEVLSNVIRHGCEPGRDCAIQVRLTFGEDAFEFEVSDAGRQFNPLLLPPPDLTVPLEQRRAGGLGVFLVPKLGDEVRYHWQDGRNHFLFRKRWPAAKGSQSGS